MELHSPVVVEREVFKHYLEKYESFINAAIGGSENRLAFSIPTFEASSLIVPEMGLPENLTQVSLGVFNNVKYPEDTPSYLNISSKNDLRGYKKWSTSVGADFSTVLSMTVAGTSVNIVMCSIWFHCPNLTGKTFFLVHKEHLAAALDALSTSRKVTKYQIEQIGDNTANLTELETKYDWSSLTLDPYSSTYIRDDFEAFMSNYQWFKDNGLPYKRGYLLYGDPGNGKTSVVRMMAAHPMITTFTIDLAGEKVTNYSLTNLFKEARSRAPSLIYFEDIDRMFAKQAQEENKRSITLQHFLNCMDGVSANEGVVVVATANHPTNLDNAILKRPGRFDRVVEFKNPALAERSKYFVSLKGLKHLSSSETDYLSEITEGLSFSQLKEVFVSAGQACFSLNEKTININHLSTSVDDLKSSYSSLRGKKSNGTGFMKVA